MEQIVIEVQDKEKARMLFELLTALDFVKSVKTSEQEYGEEKRTISEAVGDFFSLAGLWANRDISIESIRQKAWPEQYK